MVDLEVFHLRLAKLDEFLGHLDEMAHYETSVLLGDPGLLAQTERWMHLVVEASLDLGQHIIASKGWRTPATYREVFQILQFSRRPFVAGRGQAGALFPTGHL